MIARTLSVLDHANIDLQRSEIIARNTDASAISARKEVEQARGEAAQAV